MSTQRYERVNAHDEEEDIDDIVGTDQATQITLASAHSTPSSPPPSFRSQASSPTFRALLSTDDPFPDQDDQTLAETFDDGGASDAEDGFDDRQTLMRANPRSAVGEAEEQQGPKPATTTTITGAQRSSMQRRVTELPVFASIAPRRQLPGGNDGVFANLAAKPERGDTGAEKPPTYEAAAADATPPYWETTITLPGSGIPGSDEVYVDGLPVGSIFSFAWNAMISMSFQLVGFLLTYLLHTTHAAKNGSRAGLGLTLVHYGFYMKGSPQGNNGSPGGGADPGGQFDGNNPPSDPNSHDFDPSTVNAAAAAAAAASSSSSTGSGSLATLASSDWISYLLMILGWFILIRAVSDYMRARRHEQLVLQSPDRGLPIPVIASGESTEQVV